MGTCKHIGDYFDNWSWAIVTHSQNSLLICLKLDKSGYEQKLADQIQVNVSLVSVLWSDHSGMAYKI